MILNDELGALFGIFWCTNTVSSCRDCRTLWKRQLR